MSNIFIYFSVALATAFVALYIKQVRPDYALCITLAGTVFILSGIVPRIGLLISDIRTFSTLDGVSVEYIEPVLKIIGISYITEFAADICSDAGEKALSHHIETAGKLSVTFIALPIVEDVFSLIIGLLE